MTKEQSHICLIWSWTLEQLLEKVGPGPYVIYGGGPTPPAEGTNWDGIPVLHDPAIPFNCTRVAQAPQADLAALES